MFGRMHVDVYPFGRHLQIQHVDRMTTMKHYVAVGLPKRMAHQFVAYGATVHIEKLLIHLAAVVVRQTYPAIQSQIVIAFVDIHRVLDKIGANYP